MGMALFLVSIGVIFITTILAYVVTRLSFVGEWPPAEMPALPRLLAYSTGIIVVSSATMWGASRAATAGRQRTLQLWISLTCALGFAFLVMQVFAWWELITAHVSISDSLYAWSF